MIRTLQYSSNFSLLGDNITEYDENEESNNSTTVAPIIGSHSKTDRFHGNKTIEYKGRWNEIKCTIWIWICALLCTLYIVLGIPLIKYLNRSDHETEEMAKEMTKDKPKKVHDDTAHHTMYIRNLIAKSQSFYICPSCLPD